MRVVVTGGAGFLGSHLCTQLTLAGHEVTCIDNFLTGEAANLEHLIGWRGFRLVRADITEGLDIPGPVDLVLHFASPASPVDYLEFPIQTLRVGSVGTINAIELAKESRHDSFLPRLPKSTETRSAIRSRRTTGAM